MDFNTLVGKTFKHVKNTGDAILFENDTEKYSLHHEQDCCESVCIEDVCGDLSDLENTEILVAYEDYSRGGSPDTDYEPESSTWSFYNISTIKGSVTIRFYGSSNGYYGETANLYDVRKGRY